ncbi:MAG: phenylalanine--tRNA ligase subunit alpha [Nitrospirae bacterium]|nr:phenylalanine--tRNA ligase subunit alpha [Nitrospirota bacterium]
MSAYVSQKDNFALELRSVGSTNELSALRSRYLGSNGLITLALKCMATLAREERSAAGKAINEDKRFIEEKVKESEVLLREKEISKKLSASLIDVSLPGYYRRLGGRHPVSIVLGEIIDIFTSMGFSIEEGPEVETDYYNFEALNIPKSHPARDMQDTFYVDSGYEDPCRIDCGCIGTVSPGTVSLGTGNMGSDSTVSADDEMVLRTHTSPVQIHTMERQRPPLSIIAPGKVYRCDSDVTHTPLFHQVEGLMVDTDVSFANLKAILSTFLRLIFSSNAPVRFRPSFFPFTEPSTEVDIGCIFCAQKGCRVCKGTGWLEILGAGMVNPRVFEMAGYDPDAYTGFAFGLGVERITMLKFGIDDIRLFFENDLRFLRQF